MCQEIYINLDDSGKLTTKEAISVYGGLVFFSKNEKDKFITQYRSIINSMKCKYCDHTDKCDNKCPEIKNTNIKPADKRRMMNYIKKYFVVALVINNEHVYDHIINNKAARGRFTDYAIRRMIKELVKRLIRFGKVDPNKPLRLIINIDQQTTKSNGYYTLQDGIIEELKYGIINYNYGNTFAPTVFNELDLSLNYQESKGSYVVQAADLLAGTIRKTALAAIRNNANIYEKVSKLAEFVIVLP